MAKDYNLGDWKNRKDCSDKNCCCGGHNHKNVKKSRTHHATKQKDEHRQGRRMKELERTRMFESP